MPKPKGHLILKTIAESDSFAKLSPEAAVLFMMLIPHLDNYGKMQANPQTIKGTVCPKVRYLTTSIIEEALYEISQATDLKYFKHEGIWYLHALKFDEQQNIRISRRGQNVLPDYNGQGDMSSPRRLLRRPADFGPLLDYAGSTPGIVKGGAV